MTAHTIETENAIIGREASPPSSSSSSSSSSSTSSLLFGPGSITQGQLVALTSVALVALLLATANMAVCWLYRREVGREERERQRQRRQKTARLWLYHLHRTTTTPITSTATESAAEQILRKLQISHHNLQAKLATQNASSHHPHDHDAYNSLRREEAQALEELEVTTDLFRHETSCSSSRASSLRGVGGGDGGRRSSAHEGFFSKDIPHEEASPSSSSSSCGKTRSRSERRSSHHDPGSTLTDLDPGWDFDTTSIPRVAPSVETVVSSSPNADEDEEAFASQAADLDVSYDLDVAAALADLDMASTLHDLDPDTDKVSMSSVTLADFRNDDCEEFLRSSSASEGRRKWTRWSKRRRSSRSSSSSSSRRHREKGDHSGGSLPVAEFHNEAFDFSESRTAVERMNDVEL